MPRFRIQSNLHLDGFQMLDACLENVTSFEGLDDRNTGRIVFLNGSSSNKSNLHPAVFYGNEFKGLAYLDDIDKITNGEGSLGTRVKALEDMLGLKDVTNVIDTWNDVQEFFKNVDEGLNLMTMLDDKLSISKGGTITGNLTVKTTSWGAQLKVDGDNTQAGIGFYHDGTNIGYLVTYAPNKLAWYDSVSMVAHTLIHAGNALDQLKGTFLPLTGGTISNDQWANQLILNNNKSTASGLRFHTDNEMMGILYVSLSHKLLFHDGTNADLEVLHSGNVGDYTAGAANHLNSTEVSGEGSDNILDDIFTRKSGISVNIARNLGSGSLFVSRDTIVVNYSWGGRYGQQWAIEDTSHKILVRTKNADQTGAEWSDWKTIAFTDSTVDKARSLVDTNNLSVVHIAGSQFYVGDTIYPTNITHILGKEIRLRAGESATTAMTITDEGNVLVGVASQTNTDFKFEVSGLSRIYTAGQSMSLGKVPTSGLVLGSSTGLQGQFYFDYSGNFCLQGQNVSDSTTRALNLNPFGGAVNIGSANSNVYALGSLFASKELYMGGFIFMNHGKEGIYLSGSGINWHNTNDEWSASLLTFAKDSINVKQLATFNGGALIPTGQKLTIGDANGDHATIEYDSIAKAIKVDGNLFTTGTNASGGKADDQSGNTGGGSAEVYKYDLGRGEQVYEIQNVKGDVNVNIQVYEWNGNSNSWDMILTDVSVNETNITVTFGRPTSVDHMVTVV